MPSTSPPAPVLIRTTRFRCPFCARSRAKRSATAEHIARCWHNPAVRACLTCVHHEPEDDACGCEPGCNWGNSGRPIPESCGADGGPGRLDTIRTGCPLWEGNTEETTR